MNIFETRETGEMPITFKNVLKLYTFPDASKVKILGSSRIKSRKYFNDFDIDILVSRTNLDYIYDHLLQILEKIKVNPNLYFIKLKIKNNLDQKIELLNNDFKLSKNDFKTHARNLKLIKLDTIAYFNNKFIEINVIYKFKDTDTEVKTDDKQDAQDMTKAKVGELQDEIKEAIKDKDYFKVVKRAFSISFVTGDKKRGLQLLKILNGKYGKMYNVKSNLETILEVLSQYDTKETKDKVLLNLKDLGIAPNIDLIKQTIKDLDKQINDGLASIVKTKLT